MAMIPERMHQSMMHIARSRGKIGECLFRRYLSALALGVGIM